MVPFFGHPDTTSY